MVAKFSTLTLCSILAMMLAVKPFESDDELDPKLVGYDPSGMVRFENLEQANAKRDELIRFVWPDGLPDTIPNVEQSIGWPSELAAIDRSLVSRVDRYDCNISRMDFHAVCFAIQPAEDNPSPRLAIVHAGHVRDGEANYLSGGIAETIELLLRQGFTVVPMQMPVTGWNLDNDGTLPDGSPIDISTRGTAGHNELFSEAVETLNGKTFAFFMEPIVQVNNLWQQEHPDHSRIMMIGLSGGGWSTHLAAAIDKRINLSFPVAGAMPLYARFFSPGSHGDAEQQFEPLFGETDTDGDGIADAATGVASWLEVFLLGSVGGNQQAERKQIQILNFYDSCCFSGSVYETYDQFLRDTSRQLGTGSWDLGIDKSHRGHLISNTALQEIVLPALEDWDPQ